MTSAECASRTLTSAVPYKVGGSLASSVGSGRVPRPRGLEPPSAILRGPGRMVFQSPQLFKRQFACNDVVEKRFQTSASAFI